MSSAGKILEVRPKYVLPGGEIEVLTQRSQLDSGGTFACLVDGKPCRITASSSKRVIAIVPDSITEYSNAKLHIAVGSEVSNAYKIQVAGQLADGMHMVANPAIDPSDDAIVVTRSGSRGQHLENTVYRIETSGYIDELPEPVLNPTGIAFGPDGRMYVTNRADGEVWIDDMRLDAAFKDPGMAGSLMLDVRGGDFLSANITYANQSALFQQLNH